MTKKATNHVIPVSGKWVVKKTGTSRASRSFDSREKAILYGETISRKEKTDLYIHSLDGTVQNKNSFVNEPGSPKYKK